MMKDRATTGDAIGASVTVNNSVSASMMAGGVYHVQCFDKDGNLKWEDKAHNLVVNQGLKDMNDKSFSGAAYTAAWYLGLVTGPGSGTTFAAGEATGTSGILFSESDFQSPGDRAVVAGDVLNVTYQFSLDAA